MFLLHWGMAGKPRRSRLVLSDPDKAELEQLARSRTAPHREAQRAAILLGYHAGEKHCGHRPPSGDDPIERREAWRKPWQRGRWRR
jgi:hypothetical protein